jgi:hypothetical protein
VKKISAVTDNPPTDTIKSILISLQQLCDDKEVIKKFSSLVRIKTSVDTLLKEPHKIARALPAILTQLKLLLKSSVQQSIEKTKLSDIVTLLDQEMVKIITEKLKAEKL